MIEIKNARKQTRETKTEKKIDIYIHEFVLLIHFSGGGGEGREREKVVNKKKFLVKRRLDSEKDISYVNRHHN